jgi:hypothetical protein
MEEISFAIFMKILTEARFFFIHVIEEVQCVGYSNDSLNNSSH